METTYVYVKCGRFMELKCLTPKPFMNDMGHKGCVECVRYLKQVVDVSCVCKLFILHIK